MCVLLGIALVTLKKVPALGVAVFPFHYRNNEAKAPTCTDMSRRKMSVTMKNFLMKWLERDLWTCMYVQVDLCEKLFPT